MLWPTPLLRKKFPQHEEVNPALVKLFYEHRGRHERTHGSVYSSPDDLLARYDEPALNQLFQFISDSVLEIASAMNGELWKRSRSKKMSMNVVGASFQIQNGHGFHETHNHGNCSWSGVYYVQVDEEKKRENHPQLGVMNGVTRFYGHHIDIIGGGYMEAFSFCT